MTAKTQPANTPHPSDAAIATAQRSELYLGLSGEMIDRLSDQIRTRQAAEHATTDTPEGTR